MLFVLCSHLRGEKSKCDSPDGLYDHSRSLLRAQQARFRMFDLTSTHPDRLRRVPLPHRYRMKAACNPVPAAR
jgi:hypothetical protein